MCIQYAFVSFRFTHFLPAKWTIRPTCALAVGMLITTIIQSFVGPGSASGQTMLRIEIQIWISEATRQFSIVCFAKNSLLYYVHMLCLIMYSPVPDFRMCLLVPDLCCFAEIMVCIIQFCLNLIAPMFCR